MGRSSLLPERRKSGQHKISFSTHRRRLLEGRLQRSPDQCPKRDSPEAIVCSLCCPSPPKNCEATLPWLTKRASLMMSCRTPTHGGELSQKNRLLTNGSSERGECLGQDSTVAADLLFLRFALFRALLDS